MGKVMGKSQARVALEAIAMTAFDRLSRFTLRPDGLGHIGSGR